MTRGRHLKGLVALAAAALALAGCGDDDTGDPIPNTDAEALIAQLDEFQDALDAGDCDSVDDRIQELRSELGTLDEQGVGSDVQNALLDGVDHLRTLANAPRVCDQDDEEVETTPETTPETTVETVPEETTTTPPPTTTTPTTTAPTIPEPEPEPVPQPDEGDGGGQFDGGGVGPDGQGPPGQRRFDGDDD